MNLNFSVTEQSGKFSVKLTSSNSSSCLLEPAVWDIFMYTNVCYLQALPMDFTQY